MTFEKVYGDYRRMLEVMIDKQGFTKDAYEVKKVAILLTALGKQINKKVIKENGKEMCPTCKHDMRNGRSKYCVECGQRLYYGKEN